MNDTISPELARRIEGHCVDALATREDVERLCKLVRERRWLGVCVNGTRVELARALLEESDCKVTSMVGFPFGASDADTKRFETEAAVDAGAQEIELVLNLGLLKDGDQKRLLRELRDIVEAADERWVKLALETSLLTEVERNMACELALDSGIKVICTGAGHFAAATAQEVKALREVLGPKTAIKAGGIRDLATAQQLIAAGADRVGVLGVHCWAGDHIQNN